MKKLKRYDTEDLKSNSLILETAFPISNKYSVKEFPCSDQNSDERLSKVGPVQCSPGFPINSIKTEDLEHPSGKQLRFSIEIQISLKLKRIVGIS